MFIYIYTYIETIHVIPSTVDRMSRSIQYELIYQYATHEIPPHSSLNIQPSAKINAFFYP